MKHYGSRLPKFVEYDPRAASAGMTRLRFRSDPLQRGSWRAELCVNMSAARPTPQIEEVRMRFDTDALMKGLGDGWRILPFANGALLAKQRAQGLHLFLLEVENVAALRFKLALRPLIVLAGGADAPPCYPKINDHVEAVLPVSPCPRGPCWRMMTPTLFPGFIDIGWNLPIPRAPGAFRLINDDGAFSLAWAADASAALQDPRNPAIDDELQAVVDAYLQDASAASSSLLSAAALGDTRGNLVAMQIAAAAAARNDSNTLRILRVAHQRAFDRGRKELSSIACLITCNAALGDVERALHLIPTLEAEAAIQLRGADLARWVGALARTALVYQDEAQQKGDSRRRATPSTGTAALPSQIVMGEFGHTPIPASYTMTDELNDTLSPVERARLHHRLTPHAPRAEATAPSPDREPNFALARQTFTHDDDDGAWALIQRAASEGELVTDDETGAMVLRLSARFPEQSSACIAALRAIRPARVSAELFARSAAKLATHLRRIGQLSAAQDVLDDALQHVPDNIPLRTARASALGAAHDPRAIEAWRELIAHPNVEAWETNRYRKELADLLRTLDDRSGLLDELRLLHAQDPGDITVTQRLATLLEGRSALDEAVIVRAKHAAAVAELQGYASIAALVQAVTAGNIRTLAGALATAQAIELAARIAHPKTWLLRALPTLAARFPDPLLLEYALGAARELDDAELQASLQAQLDAAQAAADVPQATQPAPTQPAPTQPAAGTRDAVATPAAGTGAVTDVATPDIYAATRSDDGVLADLQDLYPTTLTLTPGEDELAAVKRALSRSQPSSVRAELLGRRALLLLIAGDAHNAALTWTGALILQPDDLRALAGLTASREASGADAGAESSRAHLLEELDALSPEEKAALPEALLRIVARLR